MNPRTLLPALFVLAACNSKSVQQVYDEARPAADVLRAKTVAAAQLVEAQRGAPAACKPTKKLTFDPKSDAHDTDFIMFEEAKRGGAKKGDKDPDDDLDLYFSGPFVLLLSGTSTNSATPSYMKTGTANRDMQDRVKRGLNVKNLILVRARGSTMDYFLVDLAGARAAIVCGGSLEATADPSLGTRTDNYDVVTKDKRTGKEIKRVSHTDTHDDRKSALYSDAKSKLKSRMKSELGIDAIE